MATPPNVGRPRTVSSSTKKRRKRNSNKTQISLVDSFEDWKALKEAGGWTHNQLARHLMDIHAAHCSHEQCSANWERASSCLGASGGAQLAPEESRSRSRPSSPFAMDLEFDTSSSSPSIDQSTVEEVEELTNQFVSTPIDPQRDVNMSFPSDISCVDSDSEDSDDSLAEAFQPLDESGESILEQSYIDEEVFCFTHAEVEDSPAVEEGLTGDCTPEQAVMQDKCVAFVSLLEDLVMKVVGKLCPVEGCHGERTFQTTKRGSCAVITWKCENCKKAASGSWSSQPRVGGMYAGNLILPAAVLLSGNNLLKVILMWKFANVRFPAASQFYSLQRFPPCN
ncbi:uncharacterized protein [Apostichopus japonicus]|uniref:uncharacterized protein n=1 Tax=Stichopus japonicus TaxID=307972 RepID=UPI003AB33608